MYVDFTYCATSYCMPCFISVQHRRGSSLGQRGAFYKSSLLLLMMYKYAWYVRVHFTPSTTSVTSRVKKKQGNPNAATLSEYFSQLSLLMLCQMRDEDGNM